MSKKNSEYISKDAKEHVKGINIKLKENKLKYSKSQFVQIYKGYDFLGEMLVVRSYIQKRYDIPFQMLELLLKLMAMRVFTIKDYTSLPKDFSLSRFNTVRERGYIQSIQTHYDVSCEVFCLSQKAQNICTNFYQMLSGEKDVPMDQRNPMTRKTDQKAFDKKKLSVLEKLKEAPMPEHFKKLYQ